MSPLVDLETSASSYYSSYLATIQSLQERRDKTNNLYLIMSSALFVAVGFILQNHLFPEKKMLAPTLVAATGVVLSIVWVTHLLAYRAILRAKFLVIDELEKSQLVPLHELEYNAYSTKVPSITTVEIGIALLTGCAHLAAALALNL